MRRIFRAIAITVCLTVTLSVQGIAQAQRTIPALRECLPKDVSLIDRVQAADHSASKLEIRLTALGAYCKASRLVTKEGTPIHFVRAKCPAGNPPAAIRQATPAGAGSKKQAASTSAMHNNSLAPAGTKQKEVVLHLSCPISSVL